MKPEEYRSRPAGAPSPSKSGPETKSGRPGLLLRAENLGKIPLFEGLAPASLDKHMQNIRLRDFEKGELIFQEGDYGDQIYYIISGQVDISLETLIRRKREETEGARGAGFISRLLKRKDKSIFDELETAPDEDVRVFDLSADLSNKTYRSSLPPGEIFGENSAINRYPRSLTARAGAFSTLLEFDRPLLEFLLRKSPGLKERLDKAYLERNLITHLRSLPGFAALPADTLDDIRKNSEFRVYSKDEKIVAQGATADTLFLIRNGFVKISRKSPEGSRQVLYYKTRGDHLGGEDLFAPAHDFDAMAIDRVEVTLIPIKTIRELSRTLPERVKNLDAELKQKSQADSRYEESISASAARGQFMDFALESGLVYGDSVLLIERNLCVRCDDCYRACADIHEGGSRLIRKGATYGPFMIVTSCRACADPVCMIGCPTGAIHRGKGGEIKINNNCIACNNCVNRCPFDNIVISERKDGGEIAAKCDLCADRNVPACEYNCPTGAILRVEPREFFDSLKKEIKEREGTQGGKNLR